MEKYNLVFKKSVAKDLRKIPNKDVAKILTKIQQLRLNPRGEGCIKLSAQERYRLRCDVYRIIYEIRDSKLLVVLVKVAHRRHVYKSR